MMNYGEGGEGSARKRSRWGDRSIQAFQKAPPLPAPPTASVSDEVAIRALLSSAQAREQERDRNVKQDQDKKPQGARNFDRDRHRPHRKQSRQQGDADAANDSYYGPQRPLEDRRDETRKIEPESGDGNKKDSKAGDDDDEAEHVDKQRPNFGLSGALTKDEKGGNVCKGVVLKFREPAEARAPNTLWRLYVYKGDEVVDTLHISKQSAYLLGRNQDIADIVLLHASCSSQHAVIQYRALPNKEGKLNCRPYLMDLESTNGSFINGVRIDPARYYQLKKGDVLRFGASTREYVLLTANTTSV